MKTTRIVLIAAGVVAVAALAKKWLTPGDVYDVTASPAAVEGLAPSTGDAGVVESRRSFALNRRSTSPEAA